MLRVLRSRWTAAAFVLLAIAGWNLLGPGRADSGLSLPTCTCEALSAGR